MWQHTLPVTLLFFINARWREPLVVIGSMVIA
jgi:hypothetical protein